MQLLQHVPAKKLLYCKRDCVLPMKSALHAVEGRIGLLRNSASYVGKPAVDQTIGAGGTQHLTALCNSCHGLEDRQQCRVLVDRLG